MLSWILAHGQTTEVERAINTRTAVDRIRGCAHADAGRTDSTARAD